jgi:hypothetical protein
VNIPVALGFVEYVAVITQTKEELGYDKSSSEDRKIVDNA